MRAREKLTTRRWPNGFDEDLLLLSETFWLPVWYDRGSQTALPVCPFEVGGSASSSAAVPVVPAEAHKEFGEIIPRTRPVPTAPTETEREKHLAVHYPFRSWCAGCVAGKAADWGHTAVDRSDHEIPEFHLDFFFMGRSDEKDLLTFLNCIDCQSGGVLACGEGKSPDSYSVKAVCVFIDFCGRKRVCLRTDRENAATAVADQVKLFRAEETLVESSPRYSSVSLGKVERANREVEGQIRAIRHTLEEGIAEKLSVRLAVFMWMGRQASWTTTRFLVKADGNTPYQRIKGKPYSGDVAIFGNRFFTKSPIKA